MKAASVSPSAAPIARQRVSGAARRALVRRAVTTMRLRHPELRSAITLEGLLAVCERLDIGVTYRRIPCNKLGAAIAFPFGAGNGRFDDACRFIWLAEGLSGDLAAWILAHELAHQILHLTPEYLRTPSSPPLPPPPEQIERFENEANYFADVLLGARLSGSAHEQLEIVRAA
jgi:Zn-dependent peptidase ImmA (M78 family)